METMTQPKIAGYRQLSCEEADLINEIKQKGLELRALFEKVEAHIGRQHDACFDPVGDYVPGGYDEDERLDEATPNRWAAIGRTHLQQGLMALTRAVAQPSGF